MEDAKNQPVLICVKKLKPEFCEVQRIEISSDNFSLGRGLTNSVVIPFISISRNHCIFKLKGNSWSIEDNSTFGIKINNKFLGKGSSVTLSDGDILTLDQTCEFVYKFSYPKENEYEVPCKRMKIEDTSHNNVINSTNDIVNSVKIKFEESQNKEIEHIEQKLKNVKQMQTTSMKLHKQLNYEMDQRIERLQNDYTSQIDNLQGEKNEIERQKALLEEERDAQLATIKSQMEQRILKLTVQVRKHNETELELLKENSLLKEKLDKERQEFLAELSRENSSKQDLLEKLEARIKEQEEIRLKDRQEALELHHQELEKLKYAKEMQIKEIEEQKTLQEIELRKELDSIRDKLQEKVVQTEQEKLKAEQQLTEQMEKMKRFNDEDKMKIEKLMKEREEIQSKLTEAQDSAAKTLEELKSRVSERETELAALAAERIQQQQEQSSEVISTLQQQLEKVKNQLEAVESEKKSMLQNLRQDAGPSKQSVLSELGDIVESELQCSICAELFVTPITLGCSHTFCHYCITMWKKKKMDCPICRARIASECKSLVLDTFIEKMVQSLSEEMKEKRKEILKNREAEVVSMSQATSRTSTRQRRSGRRSSGRRTRTIPTSTTTTENFLLPMIPIINLTTDELTYRQMEPINLTYPTRTGIDPYTAELVALEETLQRNLLNLGPEDVL